MTQLLVSVRSAPEAETAVEAGADLIDVKEPAHGPLGAADPDTIQQVLNAVGHRRPVSAAFGELQDWHNDRAATVPAALGFAKFGLAGCALLPDWKNYWRHCLADLPSQVQRVAVVYADWRKAQAPDPHEILAAACKLDCAAVLVDTFDKTAGGLLDAWPLEELARFVELMRSRRRLVVVAGSLTEGTIAEVLRLAPDFIAVRGAVCVDGRRGDLDPAKVRRLARLLRNEGKTGNYQGDAERTRTLYHNDTKSTKQETKSF